MKDYIYLIKQYWFGIFLSILVLLLLNEIFGYVCPSLILFGIPCPACGITRATKLLLTGHIKASFQMHPLLILVIFGGLLYPIIKKIKKNYCFFIKSYVIISLIIFIGFYIYRMKIYFPNKEPMVYNPDNLFFKWLHSYIKQ